MSGGEIEQIKTKAPQDFSRRELELKDLIKNFNSVVRRAVDLNLTIRNADKDTQAIDGLQIDGKISRNGTINLAVARLCHQLGFG
jgi:hypothetical protein